SAGEDRRDGGLERGERGVAGGVEADLARRRHVPLIDAGEAESVVIEEDPVARRDVLERLRHTGGGGAERGPVGVRVAPAQRRERGRRREGARGEPRRP